MPVLSRLFACILGCALSAAQAAAAEPDGWVVQLLIGNAINFNSRTRIQFADREAVVIGGDYDTEGLESPLHYTARIARWTDGRAWEFQWLHHKLFLSNRPAGVDALAVSHGFNIVTINRAWQRDPFLFRLGAGPVIAHPEAQIGAASYNGPYELAGAAALGGVGARWSLTRSIDVLAEISATFGRIEVNPEGEPDLHFSIRNPALHAQIGIGYRF